jgi:hypothetical protein
VCSIGNCTPGSTQYCTYPPLPGGGCPPLPILPGAPKFSMDNFAPLTSSCDETSECCSVVADNVPYPSPCDGVRYCLDDGSGWTGCGSGGPP